jgi:predicted secreted hydrolase
MTLAFLRNASDPPLDPVMLPRDELAHAHDMEWWYFVAHVRASVTGERLSLLLSAIRRDFGVNLSVCVLKVTDHERGSWPLAECGQLFEQGYEEWTDPVRFKLSYGPALHNLYTCSDDVQIEGVPGEYRIFGHVGREHAEIDLTFTETHPAELLCGHGIMDYGQDHRLAYYIRPKLTVKGRMDSRGIIQAVDGVGWYERQWGPWPRHDFGWKYLNIHLDDDEQLLVFDSRLGDATKRYAARFPRGGGIREYDLYPGQITHVANGPRRSETKLRLETEEGTLALHVVPLFPDEPPIDSGYPRMPTFWETVSSVTGTRGGAPVTGFAMTEMHGYE